MSTKTYTIIKVNKFGKYQGFDTNDNQDINQDSNPQLTSQLTAQLTSQLTTNQEYKEYKEVNSSGIYSESAECSKEFAEALKEFEKFRKMMKKPLTEEAKKRMLKKLNSLAPDEETQIEIIHQSIDQGWLGVFPISNKKQSQQKGLTSKIDQL